MKLLLSLLLMAAPFAVRAQIGEVKVADKAALYGLVECEVTLTGNWSNPWLQEEAALDMFLTAPSGKQIVVPCFYKSGQSGSPSLWGARFTPQECGQYKYHFCYTERGQTASQSDEAVLRVGWAKSTSHGILHPNDHWTFRYDDGTLFRGVGENICWESRTSDDSKFFKQLHEQRERFSYDAMLKKFAQNGGNFVRIWMCSWNFPIDRQRHFNNFRYTETDQYMNPSAIEQLDNTIFLAERLGLAVMLCMGPGDVPTNHDFFVSPQAKMRYKNRLRYIVARWGYSPSIGAWEFFNEIDNIQFRDSNNPIPAADIVTWHREMAHYLKELDPFGHIVTTSISHRDLDGLNSIDEMDVNQKHIYRATSVIPSTILRYEEMFGKPYVIGEYSREWDWSKNFDDFADEMDADFRRGLWYGLFSPTPITPMSWWWEYFDNRGMVPYFQAVRKVSDLMLQESCGRFEQVETQVEGGEALALRCGRRVYLYLYNPSRNPIVRARVPVPNNKKSTIEAFSFADLRFRKLDSVPSSDGIITVTCDVPYLGEALYVIH
ncbi:MAG: DUF5060 domain-containing protein [Bacteroidaceae bacterium]|nr:DUF5060 domain-containing protein [Bacteroidaceae bacterium]